MWYVVKTVKNIRVRPALAVALKVDKNVMAKGITTSLIQNKQLYQAF